MTKTGPVTSAPSPLEAWLARETALAASTRALRAQLADPEGLVDRHGARHSVQSMSTEHATAVIGVLRRHARALHRGAVAEYLLTPYPHRQHPQSLVDIAHQQLADTDPSVWLNATPLMRALTKRATTR